MTTTDFSRIGQRGLTLLEMMVVLLIGGMAIALGFQSLAQWRRANVAMSHIGNAVQQTGLIESWFQETVRGLAPIPETPFKGEAQSLEGNTTQPVQMHQGGTTRFTWSIENSNDETRLTVNEEGKTFQTRMSGVTSAKFSFIDADGKIHDQWPPKLGLHKDLPLIVTMTIELDSGRSQQWAAAVSGARMPYYSPFQLETE